MNEPANYDDAMDEIKRLRQDLRSATDEIVRLRAVISDHTKSAAGYVISNTDVDVVTMIDFAGMRTHVKTWPRLHEFYLCEPMSGWSDEHRWAFHKNVVKGFADREAEKIGKSIWSVISC